MRRVSSEPIDDVMRALGHAFDRPELAVRALTHRSYAHEHGGLSTGHNERLELLGDALVGAAAAALLYAEFPDASEGELTRRRAELVCERGLVAIAMRLGVGPALRLGRGEERSGGREKPRLLSSAVEALVGAVHQDAGPARAIEIATRLLEPDLHTATGLRDYKTRVQELLQSRGQLAPRYVVTSTEGPDHARIFSVVLLSTEGDAGEREIGRGTGRSRSEAEQDAARAALSALGSLAEVA